MRYFCIFIFASLCLSLWGKIPEIGVKIRLQQETIGLQCIFAPAAEYNKQLGEEYSICNFLPIPLELNAEFFFADGKIQSTGWRSGVTACDFLIRKDRSIYNCSAKSVIRIVPIQFGAYVEFQIEVIGPVTIIYNCGMMLKIRTIQNKPQFVITELTGLATTFPLQIFTVNKTVSSP